MRRNDKPESTQLFMQCPRDRHERDDQVALRDEQIDHICRPRGSAEASCKTLEIFGTGPPSDVIEEVRRQIPVDGIDVPFVEHGVRVTPDQIFVLFQTHHQELMVDEELVSVART